jgi:preprotein translocase subunit SecG
MLVRRAGGSSSHHHHPFLHSEKREFGFEGGSESATFSEKSENEVLERELSTYIIIATFFFLLSKIKIY